MRKISLKQQQTHTLTENKIDTQAFKTVKVNRNQKLKKNN